MVRRDEVTRDVGRAPSRCSRRAGVGPASVIAGEPSSRPQVGAETLTARAGRRKPDLRREPDGGEQARGPQHQVKPAASKHSQSESRTAHVTVKATPLALVPERAGDLGGVWGAARVHGWLRNTRDPSASPSSRQGASYKPKAKSSAAQRESEGLVVPSMVATNNATGGKGPCFGRARSEGKREGMAAPSGPNDPGARTCDVQVRQPQREPWAGAKRPRSSWQRLIARARSDAPARRRHRGDHAVVHAPSRRPSVSRVPEIGTHGLKGGPALSSLNNRSTR